MTTEVIITGTGYPVPDPRRARPSLLVRHGDLTLLFDAGRSTVQRLAGAGVWLPHLSAVFVTHHHSDHLTGLADVALSRWVMARHDDFIPLPIVVPEGPAVDYVSEMLHPWRHDLAVRRDHSRRATTADVEVIAFDAPTSPTEVWRSGDVVVSGDTLVCDEMAALAGGADVLIYEAMLFPVIEQGSPIRHFILDYHADTRLIGVQAAELGVPALVLTHLIPAPGIEVDEQDFTDVIRAGGFTGELLVADDLDKVVLEAGSTPRIERRVSADSGSEA
ncbi:MBL fold metallo-hydrolase [Candidatus Poriferisodalis sp.]|uniref:MBL fold metallo-hydrolase n=1 Tax=Candidatus Poriferisodalis sp. TaxID=3101277 RepID=UPI003B5217AF